MADFLDEVIEDVKHERFRKIFEEYGNFLVTFVLLLVFFTGFTVWYKDYRVNEIINSGDMFFEAAELNRSGDIDGSIKTLRQIVDDGSGGYTVLAKLLEAGQLQKRGKIQEALTIYNEVASSGADEEIKDIAYLQSVFLTVENPEKTGNVNLESFDFELQKLAKTGRPWRFSAMELQGLIAFKTNNTEKAKQIYTVLKEDALSPRSVKERAEIMLSALFSL